MRMNRDTIRRFGLPLVVTAAFALVLWGLLSLMPDAQLLRGSIGIPPGPNIFTVNGEYFIGNRIVPHIFRHGTPGNFHAFVTCESSPPPAGYRWATPQDITQVPGLRIYEFSPGGAAEKSRTNQSWPGLRYGYAAFPDTLTQFRADRTYYISASEDIPDFACSVPDEGGSASSSSTAASSPIACTGGVYFIEKQTNTIGYASLDGGLKRNIIATLPNRIGSNAFAIDEVNGILYWATSDHKLWRADLDGANSSMLRQMDKEIRNMAVSPSLERLFWLEYASPVSLVSHVVSSRLDGSLKGPLPSTTHIESFVIDDIARKMYAIQYVPTRGDHDIIVLDMISGQPEVLTRRQNPYEIALDTMRNRLFWRETNRIFTSNIDGTDMQSFTLEQSHLLGDLSVRDNTLYFAKNESPLIEGAIIQKDLHTGEQSILLDELYQPQKAVPTPICFPPLHSTFKNTIFTEKDGSLYVSERDPDRISPLVREGVKGEPLLQRNGTHVFFEVDRPHKPAIAKTRMDATCYQSVDTMTSNLLMHRPLGSDLQQRIYWLDGNMVVRYNNNGLNKETLHTMERPGGVVAVDTDKEVLYYTENNEDIIRKNFYSFDESIVVAGRREISQMAMDPLNQQLYWTEKQRIGTSLEEEILVMMSNADGSDIRTMAALPFPAYALKVDPEGQRIFWSDLRGSWTMTFDGSAREWIAEGSSFTVDTRKMTNIPPSFTPVTIPEPHVYFWDGSGNIMRKTHTGDPDVFVAAFAIFDLCLAGGSRPTDLAYDNESHHVYFSCQDKILRSDGNSVQEVIGLHGKTSSIEIDPVGRKIYWASEIGLMRANLDGTNAENIWNITSEQGALGIDVVHRHLYYAPNTDLLREGAIWRVDLHDVSRRMIYMSKSFNPNPVKDITVDPLRGRVYWLSTFPSLATMGTHGNMVAYASLRGINVSFLQGTPVPTPNGTVYPHHISLDIANNILYAKYFSQGIRAFSIGGDNTYLSLGSIIQENPSIHASGITIEDTYKDICTQPAYVTAIAGEEILHIGDRELRIRTVNDVSSNVFKQGTSHVKYDEFSDKMYWIADGNIIRANKNRTSEEMIWSESQWGFGGKACDFALDTVEQKIYWFMGMCSFVADPIGGVPPGKIMRANYDGSDPQIVIDNLQVVESMAIDILSRAIFTSEVTWSSSGPQSLTRSIHRVDIASGTRSFAFHGGGTSLEVDPILSRVFFFDDEAIRSANLDGSNVVTVIPGETGAVSFSINTTTKKIYWIQAVFPWDPGAAIPILLYRADYNGENAESLSSFGTGMHVLHVARHSQKLVVQHTRKPVLTIMNTAPVNVQRGSTFQAIFTITNHGPGPAKNLHIIHWLPPHVTFVASGSSQECALESLGPNQYIACRYNDVPGMQTKASNVMLRVSGSAQCASIVTSIIHGGATNAYPASASAAIRVDC